MTESAIADFVSQNAKPGHARLVPEICLLLASDVLSLWKATETIGGQNRPPPYWGFAWPGGQALARYILDNPNIVVGKTVLDFGAGCGLLAVAAAKSGAAETIAAEIDPFACDAIVRNAELNGVAVTIRNDNVIDGEEDWDVVLVGDMCYERPLAESLMAWLRRLLSRGALVLLGDPGRNYFPASGVQLLQTYDVPTLLDLEDKPTRKTGVYKLLA